MQLQHLSLREFRNLSAGEVSFGPRFTVLGTHARYVKFGLDSQESALASGARVNLEIDMLARYLARWQETA